MSRRFGELIYYVKFETIPEPQKMKWNDMMHMLHELEKIMILHGPIEWMQQGYYQGY